MSSPVHRDQRAVVGHAVLGAGLVPGDLEVAAEHHRPGVTAADDVVDGVRAAVRPDGRVAGRRATATQLVGEDDLVAGVVERGRVPEGEVGRVPDLVDHPGASRSEMSIRMPSPMQAPAARSFCGYAVMSWQPVVGRAARAARVPAVGEEVRRGDDRRVGGPVQWHLHDRDRVVWRLAVGEGRRRAVRGDVQVDGRAVLSGHQGVRVRAAVGLHRLDVARVGLVADVEDLDALPGLLDRRRLGDAVAGVVAARGVGGEEEQVAVDGDVVLGARAEHLRHDLRLRRVRDVVDGESVVVADVRERPLEGHVGAEGALGVERRLLRQVGDLPEVGAAGDLVDTEPGGVHRGGFGGESWCRLSAWGGGRAGDEEAGGGQADDSETAGGRRTESDHRRGPSKGDDDCPHLTERSPSSM